MPASLLTSLRETIENDARNAWMSQLSLLAAELRKEGEAAGVRFEQLTPYGWNGVCSEALFRANGLPARIFATGPEATTLRVESGNGEESAFTGTPAEVVGFLAIPRATSMPMLESAYIGDVEVGDLPAEVRKDVCRFVDCTRKAILVKFGMVVRELVPKADPTNLRTARRHVHSELKPMKAADQAHAAVQKGKKFILLMNDRIVDGHHFLAKAEWGGLTSSLPVLDLTAARLHS